MHRPPFWQGAESHSSTSISHFAPENRKQHQRHIWSPDTGAAARRHAVHFDQEMEKNSILFMWNNSSPVKPGMQVQMYPAPTSSHVPWFWQGFKKHSWKTCRKCKSELSELSSTETERRTIFRFMSGVLSVFPLFFSCLTSKSKSVHACFLCVSFPFCSVSRLDATSVEQRQLLW